MVHLDSRQRSARYLFWRRVLLSLTVFSLLYVGAVRPLQSLLIDKVIFPVASDFVLDYKDVQLAADVDEIDIINAMAEARPLYEDSAALQWLRLAGPGAILGSKELQAYQNTASLPACSGHPDAFGRVAYSRGTRMGDHCG